jgi:hypothetical protein
MNPRIIMIMGHAKLKDGTASKEISSTIVVALQIETIHGVILNCESSLNLQGAKKFPEGLVVGYSLVDDLAIMEERIGERYIGLTSTAFIAALYDANRQFLKWRQTAQNKTSKNS